MEPVQCANRESPPRRINKLAQQIKALPAGDTNDASTERVGKARQLGLEVIEKPSGSDATAEAASVEG
jgi:hypothetical protein